MSDLCEIVADWLREHGYDGLYHPGQACGCKLDELMFCDEPGICCEAGYVVPCDPETCENGGGCEFHIGPRPKERKDA